MNKKGEKNGYRGWGRIMVKKVKRREKKKKKGKEGYGNWFLER